MSSSNGDQPEPLKLGEKLFIKTQEGDELEYEVVGVLEDPDDGAAYAVLMHEGQEHDHDHDHGAKATPNGGAAVPDEQVDHDEEDDDDFIVTDLQGNLLEDDALAQEILDEFITFAEEAGDEGGTT